MVSLMRPFWQILISFRENNKTATLSCDECFQYIEHLAEEALAGIDQATLKDEIRNHLTNCPDCQEHHLKKLAQLEDNVGLQKGPQEINGKA
jgi:hypothetical protein